MKYFCLVFLFLLQFFFCSAQKQFEGTITYTLHDNEEKKNDAELVIMFGKNGMKLKVSGNGSADDVMLVNFDSGRVYTLNPSEKTYFSRRLFIAEKTDLSEGKTIAGYKTKTVDISKSSLLAMTGSLGRTVIYRADSLYYFIPQKFGQNKELMMVDSNHIILGAKISLFSPRFSDDDDDEDLDLKEMSIVSAEAKEVKWQTFPKDEFIVPADYQKLTARQMMMTDSTALTDSVMMSDTIRMVDTATIQIDSPAVKKPPLRQKTKTPVKSKTKIKTAPKQEARKPE